MSDEIDGKYEGHEFKTRQEIYDAGLHRFTCLYTLAGMANLMTSCCLIMLTNSSRPSIFQVSNRHVELWQRLEYCLHGLLRSS